MNDFKRIDGETFEDFFVRVGKAVENRDITWNAAADILNADTGQNYGESAYRKRYTNFIAGIKYQQSKTECASGDGLLEQIKSERRLLEQEKVKYRDERNEVSRLNREMARRESFGELLARCVKAYDPPSESLAERSRGRASFDEREMLVHLTDLHIGAGIDNATNYYDLRVAKERLSQYLQVALTVAKRHEITNARLIISGDLISGIIHLNMRLENNEGVVQQTMDAAELCSWFAASLAKELNTVRAYFVVGNHGRVNPNKESNGYGENFDNFIPFYMKAKLQNYTNIEICSNEFDDSIAMFDCLDQLVVAVHGDKDSRESVVQKLTMFIGRKPDIVFMGHRHTNGLTTVYDTKVVESGCLCGPDSFCMDKRLRNKPEQMIVVLGHTGIECLYDVKLD